MTSKQRINNQKIAVSIWIDITLMLTIAHELQVVFEKDCGGEQ